MSRHRSRPGGRLSKSVAKARIAPERWKRIVDIPRFFSPSIPARDAFATDLDVEREGRWWRSARAGPPRPKGCCEGVRVRPPGVMRGVVEGGGARGPAVTVRSGRLRVRRGWGAGFAAALAILLSPPGASGVGDRGRGSSPAHPVASGCAGGAGRGGIGESGVGGGPGGGGRCSGAPAPAGRLTWWDGVSHVVTRPGSRARHLTREIVT